MGDKKSVQDPRVKVSKMKDDDLRKYDGIAVQMFAVSGLYILGRIIQTIHKVKMEDEGLKNIEIAIETATETTIQKVIRDNDGNL